MGRVRQLVASTALVLFASCNRDTGGAAQVPAAADLTHAIDSTSATDSSSGEHPDSVKSLPPDSVTMILALLPAAPNMVLDGEAASFADRAVFAPLTQRWYMARTIDSTLSLDIGRIDGGVGTTDASRSAFEQMVASRSPVQRGMPFTVHSRAGATTAHVTGFRLSGRRIIALLDAPALDSTERAVPVEWRGVPPVPLRTSPAAICAPGDTAAISAAILRASDPAFGVKTPSRSAPATPIGKQALSVLRGCFGDFRAILALRPLDVTPETVERVTLVRANGTTRSGKLKDLAYPLHELLFVLDIDGDGTNEIVVHSYRMSMETWAALRMTDSISFTRFASGFTIEKR